MPVRRKKIDRSPRPMRTHAPALAWHPFDDRGEGNLTESEMADYLRPLAQALDVHGVPEGAEAMPACVADVIAFLGGTTPDPASAEALTAMPAVTELATLDRAQLRLSDDAGDLAEGAWRQASTAYLRAAGLPRQAARSAPAAEDFEWPADDFIAPMAQPDPAADPDELDLQGLMDGPEVVQRVMAAAERFIAPTPTATHRRMLTALMAHARTGAQARGLTDPIVADNEDDGDGSDSNAEEVLDRWAKRTAGLALVAWRRLHVMETEATLAEALRDFRADGPYEDPSAYVAMLRKGIRLLEAE